MLRGTFGFARTMGRNRESDPYLSVGSERAGRAAAIYNSLAEPCKANKVNPFT
jgi:hypothetical protein